MGAALLHFTFLNPPAPADSLLQSQFLVGMIGAPPVPRGGACTYSPFAGGPQHSAQNLSSKDGGASGLGVRDRIECGHADCPSVSRGVAVSGESDIGGFFGGSTTVCGRCSLRVAGSILLLGALAACFGISAGGIRRVSGAYPSSSSPSPVKFTGFTIGMLTFRSSIAAHPARPKPADKVKETSATRAQPPNWYSPSVARVSLGA
jgi:hypothetical protein